MTGRADRWIRRITIGCVVLLALIAGTVSYLHMHALVALHGQPGWVAALAPLTAGGVIVAAHSGSRSFAAFVAGSSGSQSWSMQAVRCLTRCGQTAFSYPGSVPCSQFSASQRIAS